MMMRNALSTGTAILLVFLFWPTSNLSAGESASELVLEVFSDAGLEHIDLQSEDIEKIGIDSTSEKRTVEIWIASKYHKMLEELTERNVGQEMALKSGTETLFIGTIGFPIKDGTIVLDGMSDNDISIFFRKIGREPDYYLKPTTEELEDTKLYTEPAKNPWAEKAIYAHLHNEHEKAVIYAKKAIKWDPTEPSHHIFLGKLYHDSGKVELAIREMFKAEELAKAKGISKYPGIYLSLGEMYSDLNEYDKAVEYHQKVLSMYENYPPARLGLARIYAKMNKYELAMEQYLLLLESDAEHIRKEAIEGIKRLKEKKK